MDLTGIVLALLALACVGFLGYLLMSIPMMAPFKDVIQFVVIILIILYVLALVTGNAPLPRFPVRG